MATYHYFVFIRQGKRNGEVCGVGGVYQLSCVPLVHHDDPSATRLFPSLFIQVLLKWQRHGASFIQKNKKDFGL